MTDRMRVSEEALTEEVAQRLIELSRDWEAENSCHGYRANTMDDLAGRRVFLARDGAGEIVGYLFGIAATQEKETSVIHRGARKFEVEELYVRPERRCMGVGRALFGCMEEAVRNDVECIFLSTATKDARRVLHFYLDELGMEFWSASLVKHLEQKDTGGEKRFVPAAYDDATGTEKRTDFGETL